MVGVADGHRFRRLNGKPRFLWNAGERSTIGFVPTARWDTDRWRRRRKSHLPLNERFNSQSCTNPGGRSANAAAFDAKIVGCAKESSLAAKRYKQGCVPNLPGSLSVRQRQGRSRTRAGDIAQSLPGWGHRSTRAHDREICHGFCPF